MYQTEDGYYFNQKQTAIDHETKLYLVKILEENFSTRLKRLDFHLTSKFYDNDQLKSVGNLVIPYFE